MPYDYNIIVIGGGSGGLVAAAGGAAVGAKVLLVESGKMGGDCLNYGCVPSKALLRPAHLAADIRNARSYGLKIAGLSVSGKNVMRNVESAIKKIGPHDSVERFEGLGVTVVKGRGILADRHTVSVAGKQYTAKNIVIATGSRPIVPPITGIECVPYFTNEKIFSINDIPSGLTVLGAGAIGLELGQGFRHLGASVSVVDMAPEIFRRDEPEAGVLLKRKLKEEGVNLYLNSSIKEIRKRGREIITVIETDGKRRNVKSDALLVALGRRPATDGLGLEDAGVKLDEKGAIAVNKYLQTSVKNIYACGDCAGPYLFTHAAGYQGGLVVRNIMLPFLKGKVDYAAFPWTTFTKPEVAHVGHTEESARKKGLLRDTVFLPINDNDRFITDGESEGFLKIILGKKGRVLGATMVSENSGEMINLASMAIKGKHKISYFMSMIFAYPSRSELFKTAGIMYAKKSFKPWMKRILEKIFWR